MARAGGGGESSSCTEVEEVVEALGVAILAEEDAVVVIGEVSVVGVDGADLEGDPIPGGGTGRGVVEADGEAAGSEDGSSGGPGGPVVSVVSSKRSGGVFKADAIASSRERKLVVADVLLEAVRAEDDVTAGGSREAACGGSGVEVGGVCGVEVILEEDDSEGRAAEEERKDRNGFLFHLL